MSRYNTGDITKINTLIFDENPKSQRAKAASKHTVDRNASKIIHETLFQIVGVTNISLSKSSQIDEIMSMLDSSSVGADRLKYSKNKIVRNVNVEEDNDSSTTAMANNDQNDNSGISCANCYFKLTLQDSSGNLIYAVEIEKLPFLSSQVFKSGLPIHLGSKLLIKGASIVEGVIFLMQDNVEFLSGLVPEWNKDFAKRHLVFLQNELLKN
ncbi:hypothetical protein WICMUC_003990 [Wickerhamomyces mucosus]|uniref:RecQ mediated genome instability protein 1 OB-fold domain-containing protein n=1 Tax=Wickerhamomyces mucosus TaxID=1378264 RepID=A0A9P8TAY9_9ASCO|nr:hypothetical protein WICMUC_003990 [Wickerhamomyces mucosus]